MARLILDTGLLVAAARGTAEIPVEADDGLPLPAIVVAEHHAALLAHARREGRPRDAHDLIIAATAWSSGRTILTRNRGARFDELPDVRVRLVPPRATVVSTLLP